MKMKLIIGGAALLLVLVAVGLTLFLTGALGGKGGNADQAEDGSAAAAPVSLVSRYNTAEYFTFAPEFTQSLQGGGRKYLQIELSVSTFDPKVVPALQQHMPVLRDRIGTAFSNREREVLRTPEGKEALRQEVLEIIHAVLIERFGNKGVEEVFFNKFLVE